MGLSLLPNYMASLRRIRRSYYYYCHHYQYCEWAQVLRPGRPCLESWVISLTAARIFSAWENNNAFHPTRTIKRTEREAKRSSTCCTHIRNKWVHFNIILPTLTLSKPASFLQTRPSMYLSSGHVL